MSEVTSIEWCDSTWSPVWGCTQVSKAETGGGRLLDGRTHDEFPGRAA